MATLVSFWSLFGDRMADLGLIDSKLGLYIKINVNNGQNKFEVHISKNVAKMAILWPKIGQRHFGARASHGHNLAIFHQILTNEHTKMTSSLRRIEWNQILSSISLFYILVFWLHFCSDASHGQCCTYGLKTTLKLLVHVLAIMASSYLKIVFLQKSGLIFSSQLKSLVSVKRCEIFGVHDFSFVHKNRQDIFHNLLCLFIVLKDCVIYSHL